MSKILVDTIDTRSGTSTLTVGSSNSSAISLAKNVSLGSSVVQSNFLQPAFYAYGSGSNQTVNDATATKVTVFNTEGFDSDSMFADNRFTPTVAGKYFVYTMIGCNSGSNTELHTINCRIYKNGSAYANSHFDFRANYSRFATGTTTAIIDMDADDYVEAYVYIDDGSGNGNVQSGEYSRFGAFRITGI